MLYSTVWLWPQAGNGQEVACTSNKPWHPYVSVGVGKMGLDGMGCREGGKWRVGRGQVEAEKMAGLAAVVH